MRVLLFGATGMVGQGVLRECLRDPRVSEVVTVTRRPVPDVAPTLRQVVRPDLFDLDAERDDLHGFDACLHALGVSSVGMSEADYRRTTVDLTRVVADVVAAGSGTDCVVEYVSGAGTDSTGRGRSMWARVKGEAENELLARFPRAVMFRPGFVQPLDGIRSKTRLYDVVYRATRPIVPVLSRVVPVNDTAQIGRAMLNVAAGDVPPSLRAVRILDPRSIAEVAGPRQR